MNNKPNDADVKAFMEANGFVWEEHPEDPTTGQYYKILGVKHITPLQEDKIYMIFTPDQAAFIYRLVLEARIKERKLAPKAYISMPLLYTEATKTMESELAELTQGDTNDH